MQKSFASGKCPMLITLTTKMVCKGLGTDQTYCGPISRYYTISIPPLNMFVSVMIITITENFVPYFEKKPFQLMSLLTKGTNRAGTGCIVKFMFKKRL